MAKPDWGALQDQFLADHAKSGVSPKDWCEARGLNYSSAKRYIKIANSQKKTANGTANKTANSQVAKKGKSNTDKPSSDDCESGKITKPSNTKCNNRSGNPNPTPRFEHGHTHSLKHGGYARRMLWPDDIAEDARAIQLEDELFRLRAASLTAAGNIGRWTVQLEDAETDEQKKILRENISAADKAMMRNTVRIESLERTLSTLAIDRAMIPKINAETEYKKAMTQKVTKDIQDDDDDGVMNVMPVPTSDNVDEWEKSAQKQQDESLGK